MSETNKTRLSSIELLKLIAIFMIVINHVCQTIVEPSNLFLSISNSALDYSKYFVINNLNDVLTVIFRCFGKIGNYIFFICTAWFLSDSNSSKTSKIVSMFIDVFTVSILFVIAYKTICNDEGGK